MVYSQKRRKTINKRDLGAPVATSFGAYASYDDILQRGVEHFFDQDRSGHFYIGKADGCRLDSTIEGRPWTLQQYIEWHGLSRSKTRLYCIKVHSLDTE